MWRAAARGSACASLRPQEEGKEGRRGGGEKGEEKFYTLCFTFSSSVVSFADYGTVLHISNVELWEGGRSLISTQGERRFKVLERGVKDGYHTAKIMFLFDERVTDREEIGTSNMCLLCGTGIS